ncbi:MAG: signal peptidase II [Planctomycetota bacterium]|nr:signal peptidase II [Planctomycetota bacterium]
MTRAHHKIEQTSQAKKPTYKSVPAIIVFIAIATTCLAADLISKHYVFSTLMNHPDQSVTVIGGFMKFSLSTNSGIVFGILAPAWAVMSATVVATVTVIVLFATSLPRQRLLHAALAMVLAGALGNAYDRLFSRVTFPGDMAPRVGQVRDFIDVYVIGYPIFNVADILLVVGVGLILLESLRDLIRQRRNK